MSRQKIKSILRHLTGHDYIGLTSRGNTAIKAALSPLKNRVLIPKEGGWLSYRTLPKTLGLEIKEVKCDNAKINLHDLRKKVKNGSAFLYQNPGGYFAEQEMEEIYKICNENNCLVVLDVSGSIGTELCDGKFADFMVCSFGKWKLVDAGKGGFISCNNNKLWEKIENVETFNDEITELRILQKLEELPARIGKLQGVKESVVEDLKNLDLVHPEDYGLVVIVKFSNDQEKEKVINYCKLNDLEWTGCPRYIRLNKKAISIEIKRL